MRAKRVKVISKISLLITLAVLICLTLAVTVFAEGPTGIQGDTCYTYGDVNGDGVVSEDDAIYLLYHSVDPEKYPIEEGREFGNEDGTVSGMDAIYLWLNRNAEGFQKEIHAYSEPTWIVNPETGELSAKYKCACGKMHDTVEAEIVWEETEEVDASCTEAGCYTYTYTATFDGVTYKTTITEFVDALGHSYGDVPACRARECLVCGEVPQVEGHDWGEVTHHDATCTEAAYDEKTCQECGYTHEESIGSPLGHALADKSHGYHCENEENCIYVPVYRCTTCNEDVRIYDELVVRHDYEVEINEPSCNTAGSRVYTCKNCSNTANGHTYTVEIPADENSHEWGAGVLDDATGITTYTCSTCSDEKTTFNAADKKEVEVDKEVLEQAGQIELEDAAIKLDDATVNALPERVTISATPTDVENVTTNDSYKELIGEEDLVFDFSMMSDGEKISQFGGDVTITIPYELEEGDDPDEIEIWYLSDIDADNDGELDVVVIEGKYSNGYVTFVTDHFSYYTVTRLTPAERCLAYGHSKTSRVVAPTCTANGYTLHVCSRCGETWQDTVVPATGHNFTTTTTEPSCTENGSKVETCTNDNCSETRETVIPKTGHSWNVTEEVAATCTAPGRTIATCSGCHAQKQEVQPQLSHDLEEEEIDATCTEKGYHLITCKDCDYELRTNESQEMGHNFAASWSWDKNNLTAELSLVCKVCDHEVKKAAVVGVNKQVTPTCEKDGYTIYGAQIKYNGKTYEDTYQVEDPAYGHKVAGKLSYDVLSHYGVCSLCNGKVNSQSHVLEEGDVITAPTCTEDGVKEFVCDCGYTKIESVPATGHTLENGVCSECGYNTSNCTHEELTMVEIEFSEKDACDGWFVYETCECGYVKVLEYYELGCVFEGEEIIREDEDGYQVYHVDYSCTECGLHYIEDSYWEIEEDACIGTCYMNTTITTVTGEVIVDFDGIGADKMVHPKALCKEETDLGALGLCPGTTLTVMTCPCGETQDLRYNIKCEFEAIDEECGEGVYVAECLDCGAKVVNTYGEEEIDPDHCKYQWTDNYVFYKDDVALGEYACIDVYEQHLLEYDVVLDKNLCSEGFTVHETCTVCGYENEYHDKTAEGMHYSFRKTIDVSAYNLCVGELTVYECACGEYVQVSDDWNHSFYNEAYAYTDTEDGYVEDSVEICQNCNLTIEYHVVAKATDNQCENEVAVTKVYSINGQEIITGSETYVSEAHDYRMLSYTLDGDSCSDGVVIVEGCADCGHTVQNAIDWHHTFKTEIYDAADYGLCDGTVYVETCACGQEIYVCEETPCQWEHYYYDDDTDTYTEKCAECGMLRAESHTEEAAGQCLVNVTYTREYIDKYDVVLALEWDRKEEAHSYTYTFDIEEGAVCSDGYIVTQTCEECGVSETYPGFAPSGEHATYEVESYYLKDYGFCGGEVGYQECPCGEEVGVYFWEEDCNWDWYSYDDETETTWFKCLTCNGKRAETRVELGKEGCVSKSYEEIVFYDADGKEVVHLEAEFTYPSHDYTYTFNIAEGAVCSDGYEMTAYCELCGDSYTVFQKPDEGEHFTFSMERYDLAEHGFCGGMIELNACPCGAESYMNMDIYGYCQFGEPLYDEETGAHIHECEICNGSYSVIETTNDVDACHVEEIRNYTFTKPNGEVLCSVNTSSVQQAHNCTYSFERNGDSCEAGYTVIEVCQNCDYSREYYSEYHEIYPVSSIDFGSLGFCSGEIVEYSCPCGENTASHNMTSCIMQPVGYDSETDVYYYECEICGLRSMTTNVIISKDDNCLAECSRNTVYYNQAGDEIYTAREEYSDYEHVLDWEYELLGESCEDGFYTKNVCRDCGLSYNDGILHTEHMGYSIESIDLEQAGLCEGALERVKCPCGQMDSWQEANMCDWQFLRTDEASCTSYYSCTNCGGTKTQSTSDDIAGENCDISNITTFILYNAEGVQVASYEYVYTYKEHQHELIDVIMNDPNDCDAGYTEVYRCTKCGVEESGEAGGHNVHEQENVLIAQQQYGTCGDIELRVWGCHCGNNNYFDYWSIYNNCSIVETSNSYTDDLGRHDVTLYTCENCDLKLMVDTVAEVDAANCKQTVTYNVTITVGDVAVDTLSFVCKEACHDYETSTVLMDGATDCTDGVLVTRTCKNCLDTYTNEEYYHTTVEVADTRVDLEQYGAVCGGAIAEVNCACGYESGLAIVDSNCNYYDNPTEPWLGEFYDTQYTSNGYNAYGSSANLMICSVTDPTTCGFAIRVCNYYEFDEENCKLLEKETWQIGYDTEANDGTCAQEITIYTGTEITYHDYVMSESGTDTTTTFTETCSVCGSTCVTTYEYSDDTKSTILLESRECVNRLNNGENQSATMVREYYLYEACMFELQDLTTYVSVDGVTTQFGWVYTYDWDNFDCTRSCTSYNYDGTVTTEDNQECHARVTECLKENTCTQFAVYVDTCQICDISVPTENPEWQPDYYPTGHNFEGNWSDELGAYVCGTCGLESATGTTGGVVLENLTESYGNGENYVIGYWNQEVIEFTLYLCLVDSNGEEILDLSNVSITYLDSGICAVSISMAEVEAAMGSNTGDLRLAFVPVNGDGSYDYAITITN